MDARPTKPSILVVDDDPLQREALVAVAEGLGFVAAAAADGDLALRAWSQVRPDVVLLDYHLPGIDGGEVTHQLRALERGDRRPIVGISGSLNAGLVTRWEAVGIDAFLAKPIDATALAGVLRRWFPIPEATPEELLDREIFGSLDDVGLVDRLFPRYLEALERGCAELLEALGRGDLAAAGPLAHRLRGSSAQLGATRMAALLGSIDDAIDEGDTTGLAQSTAAIAPTKAATVAVIEATLAPRRARR